MLLHEENLTVREPGGLCSLPQAAGLPPTPRTGPPDTLGLLDSSYMLPPDSPSPGWGLGTLPDLRRRIRDCFPGPLEVTVHLGIQWAKTPVRENEAGGRKAGWTLILKTLSGRRRQEGTLGGSVLDCPALWRKFGVLSWSSGDKMDHPLDGSLWHNRSFFLT